MPKFTRTRLEIWREHSNFAIGLWMAAMAMMWCVQTWQKDAFGQFTNWLKQHAPDLIGALNHSAICLDGFQASLIQACHTEEDHGARNEVVADHLEKVVVSVVDSSR